MIIILRKKVLISFALLAGMLGITICAANLNAKVSSEDSPCIIIDPGHGLPDGGAIGADGTIESTLNLKVSKLIEKSLKKCKFSVIMTRSDENAISDIKKEDMQNRLNIMKESGADIFVSIHMNKFTDSKYSGAQVIYSPNDEYSKVLAESIQSELCALEENKQKREIAQSHPNIYLMKNAVIPAVIVECGFLSNVEEEKLLNQSDYQKKLAFAITNGIKNYYKSRGVKF